ncbi:MAG: hypothetical protein OEN01_07845 [Candidatus Krumholzibacteria bacterium]|nr:hypothetical protein [Candidatus Krumholzibacteria bacterium]
MRRTELGFLLAIVIAISMTASACSRKVRYTSRGTPVVEQKVVVKQGGPPPHAPAHGYRHKHHKGVTLVYQSSLGVYVVSGRSHHYYHRDRYYRSHGGVWEVSVHINGPWQSVSHHKLPPGLQKKHGKVKKKKLRKKILFW